MFNTTYREVGQAPLAGLSTIIGKKKTFLSVIVDGPAQSLGAGLEKHVGGWAGRFRIWPWDSGGAKKGLVIFVSRF